MLQTANAVGKPFLVERIWNSQAPAGSVTLVATQLEEAASGGSVDNATVPLQMVLGMEGATYKGNSGVRRWANADRRRVTASSPRSTVVFLAPRLPVGPLQLLVLVLRVE